MARGSALRLTRPRKRVVALATVALFNFTWFYSIACNSLCAFEVCPHQSKQQSEPRCHDDHTSPTSEHQDKQSKDCSTHSHPNPTFLAAPGFHVLPGLDSGSAWAVPTNFVRLFPNHSDPLREAFCHSPPPYSTGRTICQKESLLRI